jgi:hypothetical protein
MRTKISDFSDGHAWRVFTTNFSLFPCIVNSEDYEKFCDLITQIFKNLFNIDYVVAEHVSHDQFNYSKAIFDQSNNIDLTHSKKKNVNFLLDMPSYSIDFSFSFLQIEQSYVFENCNFSVNDKTLLSKLPMGIKNQNIAFCSCHFKKYQQYGMSYVSYIQTISHPNATMYNMDGTLGYPILSYKYGIKENHISLDLEYLYEDTNDFYSKEPNKYFSIKKNNIGVDILLKTTQLHTLLKLYSSGVNLTVDYSELNPKDLESASSTKRFVEDFLEESEDSSDRILVYEMTAL